MTKIQPLPHFMSPRGVVRGVQVLALRWIPRTAPRDDKSYSSSVMSVTSFDNDPLATN